MSTLPEGFRTITGTGTGGTVVNPHSWGGDPGKSQSHHRSHIRASGRAPVVFIHGNTGAASGEWGWDAVKRVLKREHGYTDEHLWAISYLGPGGEENREWMYAATGNITEIREFINAVREYCDVPCVDLVGHSMGCHEILCYLAGLKAQPQPIEWSEPKYYSNVGSVILLDGGMRGLSQAGAMLHGSEWPPEHDVYDCLQPDHTPHGQGDQQTPQNPHNIAYWCCMIPGGFVDGMDGNRGITGHLVSADVNATYNLGSSHDAHNTVKDKPAIIADWATYLNRYAPTPSTRIAIDPPAGDYAGQVSVTIDADPPETPVLFKAENLRKAIQLGAVKETPTETIEAMKGHGDSISLSGPGLWRVTLEAEDACRVMSAYAIDAPTVSILSDNTTPFHENLTVIAESSRGELYYNVDGPDETGWVQGNSVTITECSVVKFLAIDSDGIASRIVGKNFHKAVPFTESATETALQHYLAGRIDNQEYLQYSQQFGWSTPFTLYKINGEWTLNREQVHADAAAPVVRCVPETGTYREPINVRLEASDAQDAAPRIYYTTDGSAPTAEDLYFINEGSIRIRTSGVTTLSYFAVDRSGNRSPVQTHTFTMDIRDEKPTLAADTPSGTYAQALSVTLTADDDEDEHVTVFYSTDGTMPDSSSPSFQDRKQFDIAGNGSHAIACHARDSKGNEIYETFVYTIDDQRYPDTGISPGKGGHYLRSVTIALEPDEACEWTKYTTDGTNPSDANGTVYTEPFTLTNTTTVRYASKDRQGHVGPVQSATFSILGETQEVDVFNDGDRDGYVKACIDGSQRYVGSYPNLAIGSGSDGKESVAILHFDTAELPDDALLTKAYLEVEFGSGAGNPWDDGSQHDLVIDVNKGYFGTSQSLQVGDWDADPTASAVASIPRLTGGRMMSTAFNDAGLSAVNKNGVTQMRLRFDPYVQEESNYLCIKQGTAVKLHLAYQS